MVCSYKQTCYLNQIVTIREGIFDAHLHCLHLNKWMRKQCSHQNMLEPVSETILDHALKLQAKNLKGRIITLCIACILDCFQSHLGSKCRKASEQCHKEAKLIWILLNPGLETIVKWHANDAPSKKVENGELEKHRFIMSFFCYSTSETLHNTWNALLVNIPSIWRIYTVN